MTPPAHPHPISPARPRPLPGPPRPLPPTSPTPTPPRPGRTPIARHLADAATMLIALIAMVVGLVISLREMSGYVATTTGDVEAVLLVAALGLWTAGSFLTPRRSRRSDVRAVRVVPRGHRRCTPGPATVPVLRSAGAVASASTPTPTAPWRSA